MEHVEWISKRDKRDEQRQKLSKRYDHGHIQRCGESREPIDVVDADVL